MSHKIPGSDPTALRSVSMPYLHDNVTAQFAEMSVDDTDSGWTGSDLRIRFKDGTNTVDVKVINAAGSAPTATQYDVGGGVGWLNRLFARVIELNDEASTLLFRPIWEKFTFDYDTVAFQYDWSTGTKLYFDQSADRHDLVESYGLNHIIILAGAAATDTVTIDGVVFTAVAGGATAADQEFNDVANSGSEAATATSLALTINDAASLALLFAGPAGAVFVANTDGDEVLLDTGGVEFTLVEDTATARMDVAKWDDLSTAIVGTPGADLS